jgi:hypothetical protein
MPYLVRLLSISLASFFLLHAALGTLLALFAPVAIRMAERMDARRAACFVLTVRLFPAAAACFVVAALCVPSFLRLEPSAASEGVGLACFAAAMLGLAVWGISIVRGVRAIADSVHFARQSRLAAFSILVPGGALPIWVMEGAPVPMALAGMLHPQVMVSRETLNALSPDQLDVALRHERAHHVSRDNLKRLLLVLTPDIVPFVKPWEALERNWARFTEWAADDAAVAGDRNRSLSLAAALLRVARAVPSICPSPLVRPLAGCAADLAARVDRLLDPVRPGATFGQRISLLAGASIVLLAAATVVLAFEPAVLHLVHEALENLIS